MAIPREAFDMVRDHTMKGKALVYVAFNQALPVVRIADKCMEGFVEITNGGGEPPRSHFRINCAQAGESVVGASGKRYKVVSPEAIVGMSK